MNLPTMPQLCAGMTPDEVTAFSAYAPQVTEYFASARTMSKESVTLSAYIGSALADSQGVWPDAISEEAGVMMPPDLASALAKADATMQKFVPLLSESNPLTFQ